MADKDLLAIVAALHERVCALEARGPNVYSRKSGYNFARDRETSGHNVVDGRFDQLECFINKLLAHEFEDRTFNGQPYKYWIQQFRKSSAYLEKTKKVLDYMWAIEPFRKLIEDVCSAQNSAVLIEEESGTVADIIGSFWGFTQNKPMHGFDGYSVF